MKYILIKFKEMLLFKAEVISYYNIEEINDFKKYMYIFLENCSKKKTSRIILESCFWSSLKCLKFL